MLTCAILSEWDYVAPKSFGIILHCPNVTMYDDDVGYDETSGKGIFNQ